MCHGAGLQGRLQISMLGWTPGPTHSKGTPPLSLQALVVGGEKNTHQGGGEPQPGQGSLFQTEGRQKPLFGQVGASLL